MKKFALAFVATLSLSVFGLTGCGGGGGENTVIENTGGGNEMSADQQAQYEQDMQNAYNQQPGGN